MKLFWLKIWRSIPSRVWLIVTSVVVVIGVVVNVLASTMFYNTLGIVLNSPERMEVISDESRFSTLEGYDTRETAAAYGDQVTLNAAREGMILLKNNNNTLPLESDGALKVSVFGKNSVNIAYGGSGSGAASGDNAKGIYESLSAAGIEYNPDLVSFYNDSAASGTGRPANSNDLDSGKVINNIPTGETPWASYSADLKTTFADYNDAAIVVFTRIGGEGFDMARSYLKLDENEKQLLAEVGREFEKVIVVLNVATSMEINDIAADDNVDAILWVGFTGNNGMMALGEILTGAVTPSGRTVDTFAMLDSNPTWNNFGGEIGSAEKYSGDSYLQNSRVGLSETGVYFLDEEEDIYVGYRYYETAYAEAQAGNYANFDYDGVVAYPFGYGLSYTTFSWTLENAEELPATLSEDTQFTVEVNVKNTGAEYSGRDVVELYVTPPYNQSEIEKSAKVLVGFAKTDILEPGEDQTVSITVDSPYAFASYDCYDKNGNGFKGYELEAGDYTFTVSTDAHNAKDMANATFKANVASDIRYEDGATEGSKVTNLYTDNADENLNADTELSVQLSRADFAGTWPTSRTEDEKMPAEGLVDAMLSIEPNPNNPNNYTEMPKTGTDAAADIVKEDENGNETRERRVVQFGDLVGVDYNDPMWDAFLDRLTVDEMIDLVNEGAFQTGAISRLGVPLTRQSDGPVGWVNFMPGIKESFVGCCTYCCESLLAATWNVDRLYDMGVSVANEGLVGYGDMTFSGWYAPGLNIHRSPMGGRNFEYYSEDPHLGGMMAASLMKGLATGGVFVMLKHFALNEQETHRAGVLTWSTEQAMREIYLKSFEIAIKTAQQDYTVKADGERVEGGAVKSMGVMSSFNRIGRRWAGGDYRLLTTILRDEWGFEGLVICDFNTNSHMIVKDMVYAGGDLNLEMVGTNVWRDVDRNSAADITVLRQASKNILYTIANSNAYRGSFVMHMPIWQIVMIVVDCVVIVGLGAWGFFVIRKAIKKFKTENARNFAK